MSYHGALGHGSGGPEAARLLAARLGAARLEVTIELAVQTGGQRVDANGQTTVSAAGVEPPLVYATPARWAPAACRLVAKAGCAVYAVP